MAVKGSALGDSDCVGERRESLCAVGPDFTVTLPPIPRSQHIYFTSLHE